MNLEKRLKQIENKLVRKSITSELSCKPDIPEETWIGAFKILIEAGVIMVRDHPASPDQLARKIYQGTITEADCIDNKNGVYDLSSVSDEQLTRLEGLDTEAGLQQ